MKRTILPTAALAIAVIATATPAFAMRDPGTGGMPMYNYGPTPPRIGQAGLNNQYADGMNLYQYVRSNPVVNKDPTGLITWTIDETNCTIEASVYMKVKWKGSWTDKRKAAFKKAMESSIETTFNANTYELKPTNKKYKGPWGKLKNCPCPNGFTPKVDLDVHENTLSNFLVGPDWQADVHANPNGVFMRSGTFLGIGKLDEADVTRQDNPKQTPVVHEFGHLLGLRHPDGGLFSGYDYKGKDPWGHDVDGSVDLMGTGMGLRPFYFDKWKDKLNSKYSNWLCGCDYETK